MSKTGGPGGGQGTMESAKESAKEQAQNVAGQAQEQAGKAADQARQRTRGMVSERSTQAGEKITTQAQDIRSVAGQLREQGKDGPAKVADQAADRAERVGSYLRDNDADRIMRDVERVARDNPWAVAAGGVVLGFAASRFLKASSRERYRSDQGASGRRPALPAGAAERPTTPVPPANVGTPPPAGVGATTAAGSPVGSR